MEALGFPQRPAIADRQDVRFHELPHEQFVRPALRSISKRASKCRAVRLGVPPRPTTTAPLCCLLLVSITSPFRFSNSPWRRNEMPKARGELHETPAGYSCVFFFFFSFFRPATNNARFRKGNKRGTITHVCAHVWFILPAQARARTATTSDGRFRAQIRDPPPIDEPPPTCRLNHAVACA